MTTREHWSLQRHTSHRGKEGFLHFKGADSFVVHNQSVNNRKTGRKKVDYVILKLFVSSSNSLKTKNFTDKTGVSK